MLWIVSRVRLWLIGAGLVLAPIPTTFPSVLEQDCCTESVCCCRDDSSGGCCNRAASEQREIVVIAGCACGHSRSLVATDGMPLALPPKFAHLANEVPVAVAATPTEGVPSQLTLGPEPPVPR